METSSIPPRLVLRRAKPEETHFAFRAAELIRDANHAGADIAVRPVSELEEKIAAGHAVVLVCIVEMQGEGDEIKTAEVLMAFGFLSPWAGPSVAYSGIVVVSDLKGGGYGRAITEELLKLGRELFPDATHFMLSTGKYMIRIAEKLNFNRAPLVMTTADPCFWKACKNGCTRYREFNDPPPPLGDPHLTPLGTGCCCTAFVLDAPK